MNVNEISLLAGSDGLNNSILASLSEIHPSLRNTEIHVSSVSGHLQLQLLSPRSHIRSDDMPHDLLERRGLSGIIEWNYLKKVVLAEDRKSTRLNSSHVKISYAVFCLKKKKK